MHSRFAVGLAGGLLTLLARTLCAGHLNLEIQDPAIIQQDGAYYLFGAGKGIAVWSSKDMKSWQALKPVFAEPPAWVARQLPKPPDNFRAPDISLHNGTYYLYYAVSAPGSNNSAIGVATNRTLDPARPEFQWVDHGFVVESVAGRDMFNAVDPNLSFDDRGTPWLALGSFWGGIKMVRLNPNLTEIAQPEEWHTVAARDRNWKLEETYAGDDFSSAVEAPFLFRKNGTYYLFASWGRCCLGVNSTSRVVVGRSDKITGPFLSKEGVAMQMGGGSLVAGGSQNWPAVGQSAVFSVNGTEYLVFHGYDAADQGRSKLWIQDLRWDAKGWPYVDLQ